MRLKCQNTGGSCPGIEFLLLLYSFFTTDMDLSEKGRLNFVQEFVDKPYLIDGR